ncbi:MAG: hypothetical protein LUB56_03050 [Coprobacillus sp.]|nr:hypothetical protein [Coprobacillus sp.]
MANYATRHKHNHAVLVIIIVIVVLIILIPVALIAVLWVLITDTTRLDKDFDTGLTFSEVLDDMVFDGLKFQENEDDGHMYFIMKMSDDALSEAMHTMLAEYINGLGIIDNYYVQMYDDTMDIAVEASIIDLIYTKVTIRCTLTTQIDYDDPLNSCIYFSIDELIIGQLEGLRDIALDIVELFFSLEDMVDSFKEAGFSLEYDAENVAFTYKFSDFIDDMIGGVDMGNASLYINSFIDTLIYNNLIYAGVSDNDLVISVDVTEFISEARGDEIDLGGVMEKVEYLFSIGAVTSDEEANALLLFLVYGYSGITASNQTIIDRLDLTGIGIYDEEKEEYTGESGNYNGDIDTILNGLISDIDASEVLLDALNNGDEFTTVEVAKINLDDISSYLGSMSINGSAYYMIREGEIRGIGICNISCYYDEYRNIFTIALSLSFSGDIINIGIEYRLDNSTDELRLYYVGNYMGGYEMSRDSITSYMDMISDAMGESSWFSMDSDYFVFNLNLDLNTVLGEEYANYVSDFYIQYNFTSDYISVDANFALNESYIYDQFFNYIYAMFNTQGQTWEYPYVAEYLASDWRGIFTAYLEDETEDLSDFYLYFYTDLRYYFYKVYPEAGGTFGEYMGSIFDYWLGDSKDIGVDSEGNLYYIDTDDDGGDTGDTGDGGDTGDDGNGGNPQP